MIILSLWITPRGVEWNVLQVWMVPGCAQKTQEWGQDREQEVRERFKYSEIVSLNKLCYNKGMIHSICSSDTTLDNSCNENICSLFHWIEADSSLVEMVIWSIKHSGKQSENMKKKTIQVFSKSNVMSFKVSFHLSPIQSYLIGCLQTALID